MMLSAINGETKLRVRSGFDFARFLIAKGETIQRGMTLRIPADDNRWLVPMR